ncbi:hypothetical protein [Gulosibacter chungangensis]|uniref:Uncharacterized protein n=1 Tax=Gulosibacter chungangensis TaxID=979746 RepID=A0A7J5BHR6_9MICO|nr:hypothetical protein [Gulosibacter chungangensis]KAB1645170.1 hypothetical protein F8O05_02635 [Gulosibacter chungangensis]
MGDGESTGLVTGIERDTIERIRQNCVDFAQLLRDSAQTLNNRLVPLADEAVISDWVSSARLTYDLGRTTISTALGLAAVACGVAAAHYDDAVWLIDQQIGVEFL